MERTIDRTSYRRSARPVTQKIEEVEEKPNNKKWKLTNLLLNQIIVSLLILIGILTAQYMEKKEVLDWIKSNMAGGYEITELYQIIDSKVKKILNKENNSLYSTLNEAVLISGEINNIIPNSSGDSLVSGESIQLSSGELISAVEGINQMAEDAKTLKKEYSFYYPIQGTITSRFGARQSDNPIVSSYHAGLDIAANTGTEIHASHSGTVILAELFSSYGNCVMIEDGDLTTVYAHCSSINVKKGQKVEKGEVIAKVGMTGNATGPHVHFEVRYMGRFIDPELVIER